MAILTVEYRGARQAGTLNGLVLIGRWPINTIAIDNPSVSRIHAWIGEQDGQHYIGDAASRGGTLLNGEALGERHFLHDGDEIRVGPAVMHYWTADAAGAHWEKIDLTPRSLADLSRESGGTLMLCQCGAPIWFPLMYTMSGRCRQCGMDVSPMSARLAPLPRRVAKAPGPPPEPPVAPPMPPTQWEVEPEPAQEAKSQTPFEQSDLEIETLPDYLPAGLEFSDDDAPDAGEFAEESGHSPIPHPSARAEEQRTCGICHSSISAAEATEMCPSCKLVFHADCWHENRGCAAYGCNQVNILDARRAS